MADKNLSESNWKSFAKNRNLKDAALLKALAELAKAEKAGGANWGLALTDVEKQVEALRKEHKADKEIQAQLKLMDAAIASEARAAERAQRAEQEAEAAEDEEGPAALTSKLIPLLRNVRKGQPCMTLVAIGGKEAAVMLARRRPTASARNALKAYLDASGTPRFVEGECIYEENAVTFVLKTEVAGLAKKLKAALLKQTELRVKVRVRGEQPNDIDDDGDPAEPGDLADESGEGDEPPAANEARARSAQPVAANSAKAAAEAAAAAKAARDERLKVFKARMAALVPRIKALADGGWPGARAATTALSEAAALASADDANGLARLATIEADLDAAAQPRPAASAAANPATKPAANPAATPPLDEAAKRSQADKVELVRTASAAKSEKLKAEMRALLAADQPDVEELRVLIKQELDRAKLLAEAVKLADQQGLPIAPPPARVSFAANAAPGAAQWTEAVCRAAFRKYGWFTFKAMRKSREPVVLDGVTTQNTITDDVMWKLYQYRRHYVDKLIAELHAAHREAGLLFKSGGSEDIESDLDITVASPRSGVDVAAMKAFNDRVKADFGRPPGRVFDTNLYARDYNAIEDNLSARGAAGATPDHAIAEPVGGVAKMAGIDQDVATLMKQRRFLDEAAFNKMWHALRDAMPAGTDRDRIRQRFEEAEDVYLLTAREKVSAIVKTVEDRLESLPVAQRAKFERERAEFNRINAAAEGARGEALTAALAAAQRQLPHFLDLLEEEFPDEVMETTDAMYAKTMGELRANQAKVDELEAHLIEAAGSANCDKVHKGVAHADWLGQAPTAINALKARIKQAQFTNIVFANEAYVSQGAITHIVSGAQASTPEKKQEVLAKIQPAELLQSANEQMADFYKDMKHLEHEALAASPGKRQRQANGEAFVHASKYLSRMLDAAKMLQEKYEKNEVAMTVLTAKPYDLCARAKVKGPKELQDMIDAQLVSLRKSSTLPGDAKAEVAVADVNALFGVSTIGALRQLITAFGVDFNERVRRLDDFRAAQEVDRETERDYFRPAT